MTGRFNNRSSRRTRANTEATPDECRCFRAAGHRVRGTCHAPDARARTRAIADPDRSLVKLLMTADTSSGEWPFALELARALHARRVRTVLAVTGPAPTEAQLRQAASVPDAVLTRVNVAGDDIAAPEHEVARGAQRLLQLAEEVNPTVVHLHGLAYAGLPWRRPLLVAGHADPLSRWEAVQAQEPPASAVRYRERVRTGLRAATAVVAPSAAMLDALERHYGPLRNARVIHGGRPLEREPYDKEPLVLGIGAMEDEAANVASLGRIARRLPWRVQVAGDAEATRSRLRARATIFAYPARYDPSGLGPLQAAMAGCALVLGDLPSLRELWGPAAVYVPPGDDDALAKAIAGLIEDPERCRGAGRAARRRASRYTTQRMVTRYLEAYAALLNRSVALAEVAHAS